MWASGIVAAASIPAVLAWGLLTQPVVNQIAGVVGCAILLIVLGVLILRWTWLDTERGLVVRNICWVWSRPAAWADASKVRIRDNHAGQAVLEVRGAGRRTSTYLPLVAVDIGGDRSQSPEFLTALADEIERWAPHRAAVVKQLRAQAEHVASGGGVRESPMALAHLARGR